MGLEAKLSFRISEEIWAHIFKVWENRGPVNFISGHRNKVHHPLAILYLIFDVNITQVPYIIQRIRANEVKLNKVQFEKCLFRRNISN